MVAGTTNWSVNSSNVNFNQNEEYLINSKAIDWDDNFETDFSTISVFYDNISPDGITDLNSIQTATNTVKLFWTSPGDDGTTGNLTGQFQIKYSTDPTLSPYHLITLSTSCPTGSSQSYTVTGLISGVTYYFRIWSSDEVPNWSPISNGTTIFILPEVNAPENFTGISLSTNSIKWSWKDVEFEDGYRLLTSTDGIIVELNSNSTFYIENGFTPDEKVERKIESFNIISSSKTNLFSVYTKANPPLKKEFSNISQNNIRANWDKNNNPSTVKYLVECSTDNFGVIYSSSNWITENYYDFTLPEDTLFYFRVQAKNREDVKTNWVVLGSTKTLPSPLYPPSAPTDFKGKPVSSNSINWSWKDNSSGNNQEDGFRIFTSTNGLIKELPPDTTFYLEKNLSPNEKYERFVTAYNSSGTASSLSYSTYTLSNTPGSLFFTNITSYSITCNWSSNSNPFGTEYLAECFSDSSYTTLVSSSSWQKDLFSYEFKKLSSGKKYYFRVFSRNFALVLNPVFSKGETQTSSPDSIPPAKITDLEAYPDSSIEGKINLSWTSPGDDGTEGYLTNSYFEIFYGTGSINKITISTSTENLSKQFYSVTGLFPSLTYYFRIRTIDDSKNKSVLSDTITAISPDFPPSKPTGLSLTAGNKKIFASWNKNPELDIKQYILYCNNDVNVSSSSYLVKITTTGTSAVIDGNLTNGVTYYVVIQAEDLKGNLSEYSQLKSAIPQAPGRPTHILLSLGGRQTTPGEEFPLAGDELIITIFSYEVQLDTFTGYVKLEIDDPLGEFLKRISILSRSRNLL